MKIVSIISCNNFNNKKINGKNITKKYSSNQILFTKPETNDCFVSFGNNLTTNFNLFKSEFARRYGTSDIRMVLFHCITPKGILGRGRDSVCYQIPGVKNFVFKLTSPASLKKENILELPIIEITDEFEGRNFGQEIAKIGNDIKILRRVEGVAHSFPCWIDYLLKKKELKKKQAEVFLGRLKKISQFDQTSYNVFAESLTFLNKKGIKMDSINPNNLIIDIKSENFGIVDVEKNDLRNTHYDMISSLLDMALFRDIYNLLDEKQQKELLQAAKTIIYKCNNTKAIFNLKDDVENYSEFLSQMDKVPTNIRERLNINNLESLTKRYQNMMQIINAHTEG